MGLRGVYVRGVDEEVYKEVKAQAARQGLTIGEVITDALEDWLKRKPLEEDREFVQNNLAYEEMEKELVEKHGGRWVAIEKGMVVSIADSLGELRGRLGTANHRIVLRIGEIAPKKKYLGGSSLWKAPR